MGILDPIHESGRFAERGVTSERFGESGDHPEHLYATAERIERELGDERQLNLFDGSEEDWERQPLPDGPITVGIDGGYVRAAHKQGWFEVIAGKSVVAFRRNEEGEQPSAKCFGFVQTYDQKPRQRLWELPTIFGGEAIRQHLEFLAASWEICVEIRVRPAFSL